MSAVKVLGAGVIGLSTALLLQSKGYQVTLVAQTTPDPKHIDLDPFYTSREAGAHWCSSADPDDLRLQEWEWISYKTLLSMASKLPRAGVNRMRSICLYTKKPAVWKEPWYARLVSDYRLLTSSELPPGAEFGFQYTTVTINVGQYLQWLLGQFKSLGGQVQVQSVRHIRNLFDAQTSVVFNCSGYGAKTLGGVCDENIFPVRGQTILIRATHADTLTRLSDYTNNTDAAYIIPRSDGTVLLGGTYEVFNANLDPHPDTAKSILDRCRSISPTLAQLGDQVHVLRHGVGLRPGRRGGIRLEVESVELVGSRRTYIIHHYGHGSGGYQSSWGSSQAAVDAMEKELQQQQAHL